MTEPVEPQPYDVPLFDVAPLEVETVVEEPMSADRRRTARQRADVAAGRHPLTRGPARPDLGTCGGCGWRMSSRGGSRSYPKCYFGGGSRITSGPATDVRAWWPACSDFDPNPQSKEYP